MMRSLILKELHALRPMALLIASILALIVIAVLASEFPDQHPLNPESWIASDRSGSVMTILLFGIMIGSGLLVGESDQGTLSFLDGLPISRTRIFIAKITAAVLVLSLIPVLGFVVDGTFGWISRSSTDAPFPWTFIFIQSALELAVIVFVISLTTALSFLRRWFALVVGLIFWGYLWLRATGPDWVALFDPHEALDIHFLNGAMQVSWRHIVAQLCAAAGLLVLGWLGFHALGDRIQYAVDRIHRHRFLRGLAAGLRMLAPVIWIGVMIHLVRAFDDGAPDLRTTPLGESAFGRRETEHYEFLYRKSQEVQAKPLMDAADETYQKVAKLFEGPKTSAKIVVDLASPTVPHTAGQTNWTKIRIPLDSSHDLADNELILAHETAHVFVEQLTDGRPGKIFRYARFLHEGIATYVEKTANASEEKEQEKRRVVAAAWSRGRIPFETLCDDQALGASRDRNLVYPLGEVFVRALVKTHGEDSIARLLRALGRKDALMGMQGTTLWRDTMQAAGLSLDRVEAAYEAEASRLLEEESEFVAKVPVLKADVTVENGEITIRPKFEGEPSGRIVGVLHVDDPLGNDIRVLDRHEDGSFRISRREHPWTKVRYMLGWVPEENHEPLFEPWAEAPIN